MTSFTTYTVETAPKASKARVQAALDGMGFLPSLIQVMAASPQMLEQYQNIHQAFTETSFNKEELTVVWQTINVLHECKFCVPAHTAIAHMMEVDPAITEALRNETPLADDKLEALRSFVTAMVIKRGKVAKDELAAFYAAGYGEQQVLEIIVGLAQKVMSNYTNHVAETDLDEPLQQFAWEPKAKAAAE
ncbi:carboxymuconolactone decarboxylase family protein [Epibacterium ulvae]|uniref:carboxymuconolactone decarboxylase family protein n=1 Tax=Epibacterium ulvae TaxID=1156985 RepID=UPI001BFC5F1B|nr:carboxymuconolactone decarboxylase family protein [Epibacterium ulvae]MBT8155743.1 carboxymuconolactone decarboxylase family protein [Epibacterium ulvae]